MSMNKKRRISSLFKRNINFSEERNIFKKLKIPDSVVYSESEIQEEKRKFRSSTTSQPDEGGEVTPQPEIIFDKILFFSDDGSKVAYFTKSSQEKAISIYSINYETPSKTFIKKINIDSCPFSGISTEKCLISNDGEYFLLSVPSYSSVYFYSTQTGSLLQTITDEQNNFGSLIAADENLYTVVITTNQLRRQPTQYDIRATSFSASSVAHYYKRNFTSSNEQRFRKIHSDHSFNYISNNKQNQNFIFTTQVDSPVLTIYVAAYTGTILFPCVNRFDDIFCKKGIYTLSSISLLEDQQNFKTLTNNSQSSRYANITLNASVFNNNLYKNQFYASKLSSNFVEYLPDKFLLHGSMKSFRILKKISDEYVQDSSFLSKPFSSAATFVNSANLTQLGFANDNFFNKQKIIIFDNLLVQAGLSPSYFYYDNDICTSVKCCCNDDYVYQINTHTTANIKNIRICRYPILNYTQQEIYQYNDFPTEENENLISTDNIGIIKIIFKEEDRSNLEQNINFLMKMDEQTIFSLNFVEPQPNFLSDPTNCPNSEFDFVVDESILNQNIHSVFCSNEYLFLNLNSNTLIFEISNSQCNPLIFKKTIPSIKNFKFNYSDYGVFISYEKNVYKLNNNLDFEQLIGF